MKPQFDIVSEPVQIEDDFYSNLDAEASKVAEQDPYIKLDLEAAQVGFDTAPPEEKPSYAKQAIGSLIKTGLGMGEAVLQFPVQLGMVIDAWMETGYPAAALSSEAEVFAKSPTGPAYKKLRDRYNKWVDTVIERHPEWDRNPPEKFVDLLTNPRELSLSVIEILPQIIASIGVTMAGRPDLSAALWTALEGQEAKDRAIESGATEEQANQVYWEYGIPAAAIEQVLSVEPAIKLGKTAYNRVLTKGAKEVSKRGIKNAGKYLIPIIEETIQEPLQGAWGDWTATSVYGAPAFEGGVGAYVDRRAQEALIAGVAALIPGGVGYGAGKVRARTISNKLQKAGMTKGFADTIANDIATGVPVKDAIEGAFTPPVGEGLYVGDQITEQKKVIDLVQTPITDQASLENYGNTIAKHLGVEGDIEWVWSERPITYLMGRVTDADYEANKFKVTIYGRHPLHSKQYELKDTIVEELAHIVKPPIKITPKNIKIKKHPSQEGQYTVVRRGMVWNISADSLQQAKEKAEKAFSRRSVHYKEFKQWMKNALEATKTIPVTESVSPGAAVEGEFTAEVAKSNNLPDTKKPLMAFKLGEDIVFSRDATSHANVPLTEKQHTQVVSPIKDPAGYVYEGKFYNREQWAEYQKAIKPAAVSGQIKPPVEGIPTTKEANLIKNVYGKDVFYRGGEEFGALDKTGALFFTDSESVAEQYADKEFPVTKAKLEMNNPLDLRPSTIGIDNAFEKISDVLGKKVKSSVHLTGKDKNTLIEYAKENGYDGLMIPDTDVSGKNIIESYIVFDKSQILSPEAKPAEKKRLTRKKAFAVGHDVPEILGWTEEQRRDFMKETIGVGSMADVPKGKKGMDMLRTLTDALNQKMQEKGLLYEKPELPTTQLIEELGKLEGGEKGRPIRELNRKNIAKSVETFKTKVHNVAARFARMERYLEALGKGMYDTFWTPVNKACNEIDAIVNQEAGVFYSETENQDIDTALWMGKTDKIAGTKLELSASQRIGIYTLKQNKRGLKQLIDGMGITENELTAIENAMDKKEKDKAEWLLDKYEAQWEILQAAAAQANIDLKALKKEFRYAPILRIDADLEQQQDFLTDLLDPFKQQGFKPEAGMIEERKPGASGKIELDAFVCYMHNVARVQRFITMAPLAHRLGMILNNKGFKQALNDKTHGQGSKLLNSWMADAIKGTSAESTTPFGKMLSIMRINGIVYAIGYNIPSSLRQTLSGITVMAADPLMMKYQPLNVIRAMTPKGYKEMENFVYDKSSQWRHRNMDRDMRRKWSRVTLVRNLTYTKFSKRMKKIFGAAKEGDLKTAYMYYKSRQPFSQSALRWIKFMDKHTVVVSWKSLYDTAIEKKMSEEKAIKFADKWTARTQPMGSVEWLPQFFRDGPIEKLLSTFNNFINQYGNFYYYDIIQAKRHGDIGWGMAGHRVMFSYILPAILFGMIGRARLPRDWKELGVDLGTYPIAPFMIVGRLIDRMVRGWGNSGTIAETGPDAAVTAGRKLLKGDVGGFIKNAVIAIAAMKGVPPTAQMIRTTEGAIDLLAGTTKDPRRLIYSEWALKQGSKKKEPTGQPRRPGRVRPRRMRVRR